MAQIVVKTTMMMITAFFHFSRSPSHSLILLLIICSGLCVVHNDGSHTCFWAEANIPWAWDGQGEREEGEEASKSGHLPLSPWPACPTPPDQKRLSRPGATTRSRYPDTKLKTDKSYEYNFTTQNWAAKLGLWIHFLPSHSIMQHQGRISKICDKSRTGSTDVKKH